MILPKEGKHIDVVILTLYRARNWMRVPSLFESSLYASLLLRKTYFSWQKEIDRGFHFYQKKWKEKIPLIFFFSLRSESLQRKCSSRAVKVALQVSLALTTFSNKLPQLWKLWTVSVSICALPRSVLYLDPLARCDLRCQENITELLTLLAQRKTACRSFDHYFYLI